MSRNFVPDESLIDQLLLSDTNAFEELFQRYCVSLYSYSTSKLSSPEDAKNIVRDIFIVLWEKRQTLPVGFSISTYLYTEVRKAVVACINQKLERNADMDVIEKEVIPGFTVANLQKARQPVKNNLVVPAHFPLIAKRDKQKIQWWNQVPSGIIFSDIKHVLNKTLNLF